MVKRFSVIITPFAAANIREAHEWLSARNPAFAKRWLTAIRDQIQGLDTLPEAHPAAPESAAFDDEIRQVLVGRGTPWKVFFTVHGLTVHVLHVRHGARDAWRP